LKEGPSYLFNKSLSLFLSL